MDFVIFHRIHITLKTSSEIKDLCKSNSTFHRNYTIFSCFFLPNESSLEIQLGAYSQGSLYIWLDVIN